MERMLLRVVLMSTRKAERSWYAKVNSFRVWGEVEEEEEEEEEEEQEEEEEEEGVEEDDTPGKDMAMSLRICTTKSSCSARAGLIEFGFSCIGPTAQGPRVRMRKWTVE